MTAGVPGYKMARRIVIRRMNAMDMGPNRLASHMGVTPKRMKDLLAGKTTLPVELLHPLARVLGIPEDACLVGTRAEQDAEHERYAMERALRARVRRSGAKCPRCQGCGRVALETLSESERAELEKPDSPLYKSD